MANFHQDSLVIAFPTRYEDKAKSLVSVFEKISGLLVLVVASIISFYAWKYYYSAGLIMSYNDAMSHLDISRRVVEGLKPGFAQIGSVWLPLPHILPLIFVWNDFLWHSGLAGSIISGLAFVGSAYFVFKLGYLISNERLVGLLASLIFMINPNMGYMQSTPMTESLLLFFFVATAYYVFLWYQSQSYKFLALAGFFTFLSTLTRYDGWMLMGQVLLIVLIVSFRVGKWKKLESNLVLYSTIACYGIILWLVWNTLIFNDPLYFAFGPFSAHSQQLVFEDEGRLFSKGNLWYSTYIYTQTIIRNNGVFLSVIASVGAGYYFLKNRFFGSKALAISVLLSPLFFNIAALYFGHSIINLDTIPPYTLFNVRYGLMMLPAIAVFAAYTTKKNLIMKFFVLIFLIIQTIIIYQSRDVITVKDGVYGASAQEMTETGEWLNRNVEKNDALILVAASSHDALIFQSGFPMKQFIHEGTGEYWEESLEDPTIYAEYIAMHRGDLVYNALLANENFLNNYEKVYDGHFTDVFRKSSNPLKPLTVDDLP